MNGALRGVLLLSLLGIVGCEDEPAPRRGEAKIERYTSAPALPPETPKGARIPTLKRLKSIDTPTNQAEEEPAAAPPKKEDAPPSDKIPELDIKDDNTEKKAAAVGAGKKGHYGDSSLEEAVAARFRVEERIIFEIQIPDAVRKFEALNNRKIASHEEFMKAIIQEAGIDLPELPTGEKYVFDPETQKLMIASPKR